MACGDTGVPVKLLVTRDFPSLPVVDLDDGTSLKISSDKWRNGLVVLGFFWVKKVEEDVDKHVFIGALDIDNGKCLGEANWNFEFQSCNSRTPLWWCPLGVDCESESGQDDSDDLNTPAKRPRCDPDERHRGDEMDSDHDSEFDKMGSAIYVQPEFQGDFRCGTSQRHAPLMIDPSFARETIQPPPNPNTTSSQLPQAEADPETLGLVLEPKDWPDINAVKTEILLPEWNRKAHAEAAGPIGTLHRLDDGGHSHKTGLHAWASRDPDSGMTCVEYWLADPPLPILAGLGQTTPAARTRRGGLAAQPALRASQLGTSHSPASPMGGNDSSTTHPQLIRDIGGSRAMLAKDKRMLFVHVTCPQHANLSNVPDKVFSEFASQVHMERQVNTKD
ncbi:hypothetical protein FRC06_008175 [Ceratobasidium sp. 370]|nr:hypothetical protein FRC06_008175 [Ceratobasidium sp. 370]